MEARMLRMLVAALMIAAVATPAACANDSYGSAVVTAQAGDPAAVIDLRNGISIPEGSAASAHIQLVAVDGDDLTGNLESKDPDVLQITQSTGEANGYVFLGVTAGTTSVVILANGLPVGTVRATVTSPAPGSIEELPVDGGLTGEPDGGDGGGLDGGDEGDGGD